MSRPTTLAPGPKLGRGDGVVTRGDDGAGTRVAVGEGDIDAVGETNRVVSLTPIVSVPARFEGAGASVVWAQPEATSSATATNRPRGRRVRMLLPSDQCRLHQTGIASGQTAGRPERRDATIGTARRSRDWTNEGRSYHHCG